MQPNWWPMQLHRHCGVMSMAAELMQILNRAAWKHRSFFAALPHGLAVGIPGLSGGGVVTSGDLKRGLWGLKEDELSHIQLPATKAGEDLALVVVSPSWPHALSPQHKESPLALMPQECSQPVLIAVQDPTPDTSTGTELSLVVPSPSLP